MSDTLPEQDRTPGGKLLFAVLIAALLAVPLFAVYLLVYDRQSQSETARQSITEGWGGPQTIAGPVLVIPYQETVAETTTEGGRQVTRARLVNRELHLQPQTLTLGTTLKPEERKRSIYAAVVYDARLRGDARYALPGDLPRYGVQFAQLQLNRAELRFGLSDARGVAADNQVRVNGRATPLQPGNGAAATGGSGFFAFVDASTLAAQPLGVEFSIGFRGNADLTLRPAAGQTTWTVTSPWRHASYQGGFLPTSHDTNDGGFTATYKISNLALGSTLVWTGDAGSGPSSATSVAVENPYGPGRSAPGASTNEARVSLITPVDLYSQVNRSVKYGFLFIGFTFMAFLMFDVIGGVRVSAVEYLLVGTGLVLFFVMLLAFAEVIGFTLAYLLASVAIIGLLTAYSAAVLRSWRRAGYIAGLLVALYAVLYVLLSLEAYSLIIGSLLLFAALAAVMYLTRHIDWGGRRAIA
jgi:inner membrane protein